MCLSGVRIFMMLRVTVPVAVLQWIRCHRLVQDIECCVAVRGTSIPGTHVRPIAAGIVLGAGASTSASGWFVSYASRENFSICCSALLFYHLTRLSPVEFFPCAGDVTRRIAIPAFPCDSSQSDLRGWKSASALPACPRRLMSSSAKCTVRSRFQGR